MILFVFVSFLIIFPSFANYSSWNKCEVLQTQKSTSKEDFCLSNCCIHQNVCFTQEEKKICFPRYLKQFQTSARTFDCINDRNLEITVNTSSGFTKHKIGICPISSKKWCYLKIKKKLFGDEFLTSSGMQVTHFSKDTPVLIFGKYRHFNPVHFLLESLLVGLYSIWTSIGFAYLEKTFILFDDPFDTEHEMWAELLFPGRILHASKKQPQKLCFHSLISPGFFLYNTVPIRYASRLLLYIKHRLYISSGLSWAPVKTLQFRCLHHIKNEGEGFSSPRLRNFEAVDEVFFNLGATYRNIPLTLRNLTHWEKLTIPKQMAIIHKTDVYISDGATSSMYCLFLIDGSSCIRFPRCKKKCGCPARSHEMNYWFRLHISNVLRLWYTANSSEGCNVTTKVVTIRPQKFLPYLKQALEFVYANKIINVTAFSFFS